jgi:hypothetical protein
VRLQRQIGRAGGNRTPPQKQGYQLPYSTDGLGFPQHQTQLQRGQRLDARAAELASGLALADAKRALLCHDPDERAELRANSAIFQGLAKRLRSQVPA